MRLSILALRIIAKSSKGKRDERGYRAKSSKRNKDVREYNTRLG
ncbi:MAG: hypothetical protein ACXWWC_05260 [Chitinophagaceae bacterium]